VRLPNRHQRGVAFLLAPYVLGLVALVAVPAVFTFVLALFEHDFLGDPTFVGLDNFAELFADPIFRLSLRNTLVFVLWSVPLRLLGVVLLAMLLHPRFRGVGGYRTATFLPTVIPDVAYALVWVWILNPLYGPLNLTLDLVGLPTFHWMTVGSSARLGIVIMTLFTIGEGFLIALATRQAIPSDLYDLAEVEGARPSFVWWRITLPLMAPTLALLVFRDTVFLFQANFVATLLVTNGGPAPYATTFLPLFVFREAFEYLHYGYGAAIALVMFLVTGLIVYLQWRIVQRWRHAMIV
jgi:multiple sugar transport system permease protein